MWKVIYELYHYAIRGNLRPTTATATKPSPQKIIWLYHKFFAIIQSRSRLTMWVRYPKNKLVRAVLELKQRMKDSLLHTDVVAKTSNLAISRRRYAGER